MCIFFHQDQRPLKGSNGQFYQNLYKTSPDRVNFTIGVDAVSQSTQKHLSYLHTLYVKYHASIQLEICAILGHNFNISKELLLSCTFQPRKVTEKMYSGRKDLCTNFAKNTTEIIFLRLYNPFHSYSTSKL